MSRKRITAPWGTTYVHLVSRTVDRDFKFETVDDKRMIRDILRRSAKFSGVRVITFAILSNHFHFLVAIPPRPGALPLALVEERIGYLYEGDALKAIRSTWNRIEQEDGPAALEEYAETFRRRMYDMGEFMKTCKQRITLRYNKHHHRTGTLWESRYKSLLVQGDAHSLALRSIAAYIDLNPVRGGIVDDPATYPFSGYGEAMAGDQEAREALKVILPATGDGRWAGFDREYRRLLYRSEEKKNGPMAAQRIRDAMEGHATPPDLLRRTIRFFTDGLAVGDRDFVNDVFRANRSHFGAKRKDGARPIPHCPDWRGLVCTARDLRLRAISAPPG